MVSSENKLILDNNFHYPQYAKVTLSVIIPTYNESENILQLIEAIKDNLPQDIFTVVADDSSPDKTGKNEILMVKNRHAERTVNYWIPSRRRRTIKKIIERTDVVTIAGSRPEIIKLSGLVKLLNDSNYKQLFLYTGQHYSQNMKDFFFDELAVQPDYDLRTNTSDTTLLKINIAKFLLIVKPQFVIVYGDTNSSLAGALAAKDVTMLQCYNCKVIHIEAGLRSFDMRMQEERNRIQIDALSDYLFVPTELAKTFLKYENIEDGVYVTGNLIADVCRKFSLFAEFKDQASLPDKFLLLTLHRAENVDDPATLYALRKHLSKLKYNIVFPIHPRTRNSLVIHKIHLPNNVKLINPVGYLDFLGLLKKCTLVLTDSGGVQEEAILLGKPCITLRNSTERQETLLLRANRLFPLYGNDESYSLSDVIKEVLETRVIHNNPYGENVTIKTMKLLSNLIINNQTAVPAVQGGFDEQGETISKISVLKE